MIDIKVLPVGPIMTNCYILTDEKAGVIAVVDPGGKSETLLDYLDNSDMELKYVILTHGHYDHIGYANQLAKRYNANVLCSLGNKVVADKVERIARIDDILNNKNVLALNRLGKVADDFDFARALCTAAVA